MAEIRCPLSESGVISCHEPGLVTRAVPALCIKCHKQNVAMKEAHGSGDRYFQQDEELAKLVPEGIEGMVPYKGPISAMVQQLVGGLRAGMGYSGCSSVRTLQAGARFIRISPAVEVICFSTS